MAVLHVLYGSATGTAQDVAEQIGRMGIARNIHCQVLAMNEFSLESLSALRYAVFVASSTGDGEAPDNMSSFWKFLLRKSLPKGLLQDLQMAVFGLGDSSYAKYNAVARRLQARLLQLGATEIIERGLGDDQHAWGYHGALNPWLEKLWDTLLATMPFQLPPGFVVDDSPKMTAPRYSVEFLDDISKTSSHSTSCTFYAPPNTVLPSHYQKLVYAPVVRNERLTAADWAQDVRHIELDISHTNLTYAAGDTVLLYPENVDNDGSIAAFLTRLRVSRSSIVSIHRLDGKPNDIPSPCSIEDLMHKYLDVFGTPRRLFFERMSLFATEDEEKQKLLELASPEGADLLSDYCTREKRTYIEVSLDFTSVIVPLPYLLEMIPRVQPRAYSISSAPALHPHHLHLTVAIVDYVTPYKRRKTGVASAYIASRPAIVPLWVQTGLFRLTPAMQASDVLCIGPGTGIAVMRAIVQDRMSHMKRIDDMTITSQNDDNVHRTTLETHVYFGCRHSHADFLYADEWKAYLENGTLTSFEVAFSRDQPFKLYVQSKLAETKSRVFRVLSSGGYCFVAGSAKRMPTDVYDTIRDIVANEGKLSIAEADTFMKTLIRQKRYLVESWS